MLPVPLSPASSWARYRNGFSLFSSNVEFRVVAAFFFFGLINNVLYVIILSAALDLVGPSIPKGVVLLADVVPSFVIKLIAPYFIHIIPYASRIVAFVVLSASGMFIMAFSPDSISIKLFGVALASLSSGCGELNFLGLTHFYGHSSLAAWSSGTGAAGLVGAGAYVIATTSLGLSSRTSLMAFAFLPLIMLISFFVVLPREILNKYSLEREVYDRVASNDEDVAVADDVSSFGTSTQGNISSVPKIDGIFLDLKEKLQRARGLFFPFMLPLLLVYVAEYCINQGVSPTLLFPISSTPFREYRDFYPTYNAVYQIGVFISRSSSLLLRIHNLYVPSILQIVNLAFLTTHAMFDFIPSVWIVFLIIFWEGLLGGLVYVNTFAEIIDNVPLDEREFSLSATTVSDSGGIFIAGILSMGFETALCKWQVNHGRDLCLKT